MTTSAWTVDDPNVNVQNSPSLLCQWSRIDQPSARTFVHPSMGFYVAGPQLFASARGPILLDHLRRVGRFGSIVILA